MAWDNPCSAQVTRKTNLPGLYSKATETRWVGSHRSGWVGFPGSLGKLFQQVPREPTGSCGRWNRTGFVSEGALLQSLSADSVFHPKASLVVPLPGRFPVRWWWEQHLPREEGRRRGSLCEKSARHPPEGTELTVSATGASTAPAHPCRPPCFRATRAPSSGTPRSSLPRP